MRTNVPLSEVCHIVMGQAPSGASYNQVGEGLPLIAGAGDFGEIYPKPKKFTKEPTNVANSGDIIMCIRATIGNLNLADRQVCLGRGVAGLRPKNCGLNSQYLWHWLSYNNPNLEKLGKGSTFKQVVRADIEGQLFSVLPEPGEQKRIATILDKADAIRRKRRQGLAEMDSLLRATFLDMFGDPATNPKGFDIGPVQRVLSRERAGTQSGPFGAALKKHELVSQGIPVWGIENVENNNFNPTMRVFITPEKFAELERYDVRDDDVLISRAGTVGRMCIARPPVEPSVLSTNLVRVSLDHSRMLPEYFVTLFTSFPDRLSRLRANKKDNAFSFLNPGTLRVLDIPRPGIELQIAFAKRVRAIASSKQLHTRAIEEAVDLFDSISQRAFRGEL
jgi:type I restriction enzyme S subunit